MTNLTHELNPNLIKESEEKLYKFVALYWVIVVFISDLLLFYRQTVEGFMTGNILWSIGSVMILFSILHTRYFDVKKNCNPDNQMLRTSGISELTKDVEWYANNSWIWGFGFMAVSRFVDY